MAEERDLVPVVDEGLGSSAYLLGLGDGSALVVDPPRDVRAVRAAEFTASHVPGADHVELGSLAAVVDRLPAEPTVLICGHGERASGAASLLKRAGRRDLAVLLGAPQDRAAATGGTLSTRA